MLISDFQAMDRAHRIGQTRPVLVFRMATAHSVEGRLLQRANSKLMLERLVIKQVLLLTYCLAEQKCLLGALFCLLLNQVVCQRHCVIVTE